MVNSDDFIEFDKDVAVEIGLSLEKTGRNT